MKTELDLNLRVPQRLLELARWFGLPPDAFIVSMDHTFMPAYFRQGDPLGQRGFQAFKFHYLRRLPKENGTDVQTLGFWVECNDKPLIDLGKLSGPILAS